MGLFQGSDPRIRIHVPQTLFVQSRQPQFLPLRQGRETLTDSLRDGTEACFPHEG